MTYRDFWISENGSAGAWSLFIFMTGAAVAGLAIDGTNGLRAREHLFSTADIAAHAGVVALAKGESDDAIVQAVRDSVEVNMPYQFFGRVLGDPSGTVSIGYYDANGFTKDSSEPDNAVHVALEMSSALGNALPTFLLGFVGLNSLDVAASSTVAMGQSADCVGNDGIYSHGEIKMTSTSEIGPGFCIFSKDVVEMSNHNTFKKGAHIGMPDLAQCSHCDDAHNPGVDDAKFEGNMLLADVGAHVDNVIASLLGTGLDNSPADDFLYDAKYTGAVTPLTDLGYKATKISKGSIIEISAANFESMPTVPPGLIYAVYCGSPLAAKNPVTLNPSTSKKGGSGPKLKTLSMETPTGATISDVAVVTDCKLNFGNTAQIVDSIIATSSTSVQSLSASSYAKIGNGALVCPSQEKVVILTKGDMSIPAGMETNNVDFYIAGDAKLASGTSIQATKLGTSFYVGGSMHISAQGNWYACGDDPDSLTPSVEAIRHVIASVKE